jgi:UTP--glucose-1-phosphate uridylyltransferase
MLRPVRTAVLPVAGLGTRFLPATKSVPKEMTTIVDRPLIQYAVEECLAAGIDRFVFVTGRNKEAIESHFDHATELEETLERRGKKAELAMTRNCILPTGNAIFTRQQQPLGLGHAVWCARHWLAADEPFAVLLPDELMLSEPSCIGQLKAIHEKTQGNVIAVMDVPREQTDRYGIVAVKNDDGKMGEVTGMVEKPKPAEAPSTLSIIGRYILLPDVFGHLDRHEKGAGGEIQLTDAMAKMIGSTPFHAPRFTGKRYDCGNPLGFLEANVAVALHRPDTAKAARAVVERALKG